MPEWFTDNSATPVPIFAAEMAIRLIAACLFGFLVAVSYRFHRQPTPVPVTFPLTLVLLSILSQESQEANLTLRVALGTDYQRTVVSMLESNFSSYQLVSAETARGGSVLEWAYSVRFRQDTPESTLLERLSKVEGIQNVEIKILNKPN